MAKIGVVKIQILKKAIDKPYTYVKSINAKIKNKLDIILVLFVFLEKYFNGLFNIFLHCFSLE